MDTKRMASKQAERFEDALMDATLDMLVAGEMSDDEQRIWFKIFREIFDMDGFRPAKDLKKSILRRIQNPIIFGLMPVKIPGGLPSYTPDLSYNPREVPAIKTSRYLEGD